jgi:hypothetical protein
MPRAFLIPLLIAAQLISWNACPLFLCRDHDGTLCVDLGPSACTCCGHHDDNTGDERTCEDSPDRVTGVPCDCTHVQITIAWTAVTVSREGHRPHLLPSLPAFFGENRAACLLSPRQPNAVMTAASYEFPAGDAAHSVVLRC